MNEIPSLSSYLPGLNHTVDCLFAHLGAMSFSGALVLCGAPRGKVKYRFPDDASTDYEVRGMPSAWNPATGTVDFSVGLLFPVNGTPGEAWEFVVSYEPGDDYRVWLTAKVEGKRVVIDGASEVYGDGLSETVIRIYDEAIRVRNGGFISLGED